MQGRQRCTNIVNPKSFLLTAKSMQLDAKDLHPRSLKDFRVGYFLTQNVLEHRSMHSIGLEMVKCGMKGSSDQQILLLNKTGLKSGQKCPIVR